MANDTAGNILNDAASLCGLGTVVDAYSSTDPAFIQLRTILKYVGRAVAVEHDWSRLIKEYTFTTVLDQSPYDLPSDFERLIDSTGWNRTSLFPWIGPATPQEWQLLVARNTGATYRSIVRRKQGQIHLYPPTAGVVAGDTIAFEYLSTWWTSATGGTAPTADAPTVYTDICWLDPSTLVQGVRLKFLQAKGFDSTAAQADFDSALAGAKDSDVFARTVNMVHPTSNQMIGDANIPLNGFGIP